MESFGADEFRLAGRNIETLARFLYRIPPVSTGRVPNRHAANRALAGLVAMFEEWAPGGLRASRIDDAAQARFPLAPGETCPGEGYDDVLAELREAGFTGAAMAGSGGIDLIEVPLSFGGSSREVGGVFLIGEDADFLDLPARADLSGWRIVLQEPRGDGGFTIYRGGPEVAAMVEAAAGFARMNGYLPTAT
jgi:hypothetical protein